MHAYHKKFWKTLIYPFSDVVRILTPISFISLILQNLMYIFNIRSLLQTIHESCVMRYNSDISLISLIVQIITLISVQLFKDFIEL